MPATRKTLLAALVGFTATAAWPALAAVPETVTVDGQTLVLNGYGTREALAIDLYTAALYLPRPMSDADEIEDPALAKAFRIEVVYQGALPDEIPETWREELLPPLNEGQAAALRRAYRTLARGDVITVSYAPGSGTTVALNGEAVLRDPGHGLIAGCLDLWLGPDPVSEDLRARLLRRADDVGGVGPQGGVSLGWG
jgi:hypothetical protein